MNQVPRPDQKMLMKVFTGQNRPLYKKLKKLIEEDLKKKRKAAHWIWYMYPQSKKAVEGTPAHYEYANGADFREKIFTGELYQTLFQKVNRKPLEWFPDIDKIRVSHFRDLHADMIAESVSGTTGIFTDHG